MVLDLLADQLLAVQYFLGDDLSRSLLWQQTVLLWVIEQLPFLFNKLLLNQLKLTRIGDLVERLLARHLRIILRNYCLGLAHFNVVARMFKIGITCEACI
jgi:hypothetical protein